MKATIYVRAARHRRFRRGHKIEASMIYNPDPLTVGTPGSYDGEHKLHTAHFALQLNIPDEMMQPGALPHLEVTIEPEDVLIQTPPAEVEQAAVPALAEGDDER